MSQAVSGELFPQLGRVVVERLTAVRVMPVQIGRGER